jgi:hypothetical protein
MGSVPKPASLEIRGLDNEMRAARSSPHKPLVWVSVQWRDAEQIPTLLSILSDIPPAPNDHDLEVMRRDDGRYTLITNIERYVNSSTGQPLFDLVRRDGFPPQLEETTWSMVAISSNGTSRVSITLRRKNTRFCYSTRLRESTKSERVSKIYRTSYGTRPRRVIIGQYRR